MARAGYRIFDADTHIIEPVEPIEAYLSGADRAKLADSVRSSDEPRPKEACPAIGWASVLS